VLIRRDDNNNLMKFFMIFIICVVLYLIYIAIASGPITFHRGKPVSILTHSVSLPGAQLMINFRFTAWSFIFFL
jgi:hypothetical protein